MQGQQTCPSSPISRLSTVALLLTCCRVRGHNDHTVLSGSTRLNNHYLQQYWTEKHPRMLNMSSPEANGLQQLKTTLGFSPVSQQKSWILSSF